jgi:hypothetical protein
LNGFTTAETHFQLLLGILLVLAASQFTLYCALKWIFESQFTGEEYFGLSLAGWLYPASLFSFLWYFLTFFFSPRLSLWTTLLLIFIVGLTFFTLNLKTTSNSSKPVILFLLILTALFIILRLAFVSKAILPLYFDSAQHYLFTKNILASLEQENRVNSFLAYYHLGFHFLAAFITFITHAQINDTMLVLGQVILALMSFSVFFIVRFWTRANLAGFFAILLAAFGWYMPAHAVEWGKYPALAGIALLPFVLSMACLSVQNRIALSRRKYWSLNAILLTGILVTIFLHSRVLIVFGIAAITWILTFLWGKLKQPLGLLVFAISILASIAEAAIIQKKGLLGPLFDPYTSKGLLITCVVLFLTIFAYLHHPRLVFFCIVSVFLLLISQFIYLGTLIPGYVNTTLLDRPFVEMFLYLPLAILGGFGLAGLEQTLQSTINIRLNRLIGVLFILLVSVNAFFKYNLLYPSDCCVIVSPDDLTVIEWMDKNLPQDARILISSTDLNVLPTTAYQGSAGGDAGAWITPLINRVTIFMPFNKDFSQQQTLENICQLQMGYVYVGKTGSSFNDSTMSAAVYKSLFSLPKARVYQVTGCK